MTISPQAWNKILDRIDHDDAARANNNVSEDLRSYFKGKYFATVETVADILNVRWEVASDKLHTAAVARRLMK